MKKLLYLFAIAAVAAGCGSKGPDPEPTPSGNSTKIKAEKAANCIVVRDAATHRINATIRGNGVLPEGIGADEKQSLNLSMEPAGAKLVWESEVGWVSSVSFSKEHKTIDFATKGTAGNALIAAVTDHGLILWSWHIWNPGTEEDIGMLNLGAVSITSSDPGIMGLLYQWGRKEPFPSANQRIYTASETRMASLYDADGEEISILPPGFTGVHNDFGTCIQNPLEMQITHWLNTDTNGDYLKGDKSYDDLWGGVSGKKTLFDPCPDGYRVMPLSYFDPIKLEESTDPSWVNGGWMITRRSDNHLEAYLPACGHYDGYEGLLQVNETGKKGYYWLSDSASDRKSKAVIFDRDAPQGHGEFPGWENSSAIAEYFSIPSSRSDAYSVRCLKEE